MIQIVASTPAYSKSIGKLGEPRSNILVQEFEVYTGAKFPLIPTLKVDSGYAVGTNLTFHPSSFTVNKYGNLELSPYPQLINLPSVSK